MNTNGFIAEVQSLRESISTNHSYDPWIASVTMAADRKAVAKLHMYMETVFERDRDKRIHAIGLLVGRKLDSTVGRKGLTRGELYALLSWCEWEDACFPAPRPDAESVLTKLRDNPQKWGPMINRLFGKATLPTLTRIHYEQTEAPPF